MLLRFYKIRVRSVLEYGSIIWNPCRISLSDMVESVQRRFTRLFPDLSSLPYRERLCKLNLLSLNARRLRYQLIFLYKILNNLVDVNPSDYFSFPVRASTRGNPLKLLPSTSTKDCRRHFFSIDIVFHWNRMTHQEVSVNNVNDFKRSVLCYFLRSDIW